MRRAKIQVKVPLLSVLARDVEYLNACLLAYLYFHCQLVG